MYIRSAHLNSAVLRQNGTLSSHGKRHLISSCLLHRHCYCLVSGPDFLIAVLSSACVLLSLDLIANHRSFQKKT
ncbi:putative Aminopeptidase Npepl1 [Manis pentadactyla]|nr:putative Aminopeptidase Npepl1 [Manis pentadactyla]